MGLIPMAIRITEVNPLRNLWVACGDTVATKSTKGDRAMPEQSAIWWDAAAVFVAFCALVLTIKSHAATREHNRVSVRPRLATTVLTSRTPHLDGSVTLTLRALLTNVGLGPAVVKRSDVLLDGKEELAEEFADVQLLLERVFPGILLGPTYSFHKLRREHAIEVGKEVEIVAFEVLNPSADFDKEIQRLGLRVCFESLYGDRFTYDSQDHLGEPPIPRAEWWRGSGRR